MGMLPSYFQIDEMTSGFFLFTSFSISSEATDILTTANKTIHPWGQFRKAASPPRVVFLSVWATVSSGQGSCLASWQALFLVRPHQTLSWGEQRRWWHPFLLFRFSESSLAKASQNTARVGGRGTLLGVKKVAALVSVGTCRWLPRPALLSKYIQDVSTSLCLLFIPNLDHVSTLVGLQPWPPHLSP